MNKKLSCCPNVLCKSDDIAANISGDPKNELYQITCSKCGCKTPPLLFRSALHFWNTRTPDTSKIEAIKILDEAESLINNGMYKFVIDKIRYARRLLK